MDEANLQIEIHYCWSIHRKVDLLARNDLRQALSVFMREHVRVVCAGSLLRILTPSMIAQNTDPHRRGNDFYG